MRRVNAPLSLIVGLGLLLIVFSLLTTGIRLDTNKIINDYNFNKNIPSSNIDSNLPDLFSPLIVAGGGGGTKSENTGQLDNINFRWGLRKIHAPEAWEITQGSEQITVAVIDSGIDYDHPALKEKMWANEDEIPGNGKDDDNNGYIDDIHGWDFRDDDNSSLTGTPLHWHGTFVAGLIGAALDRTGISGVAPQVKIMDLRFLDSENRFYGSDWDKFVKAIDYAVENGADVINLSIYAYGEPPDRLEDAIQRAVENKVIVVGVTGNNSSKVQYPGGYDSVIAVTATDEWDQLASYSNFGPEVAVGAPGDRVVSAIPGGKYSRGKGTSFAAPHLSGLVALLLSVEPTMSLEELNDILKETSLDLGDRGWDDKYGYGLIDASGALKQVMASNLQTKLVAPLTMNQTAPKLIGGSQKPPQDLDQDGLYEDVNGDGKVTERDVVLLGFNLEAVKASEDWKVFDFNQDGSFDFKDITTLRRMVENR